MWKGDRRASLSPNLYTGSIFLETDNDLEQSTLHVSIALGHRSETNLLSTEKSLLSATIAHLGDPHIDFAAEKM